MNEGTHHLSRFATQVSVYHEPAIPAKVSRDTIAELRSTTRRREGDAIGSSSWWDREYSLLQTPPASVD
jgi:hypothetical protein